MPQPPKGGQSGQSFLSKLAAGLVGAAKGKVTDTKRKVADDPVRFGAFVAVAASAVLGKLGKKMPPLATNLIGSLVTATVTEVVRSNVKPKAKW